MVSSNTHSFMKRMAAPLRPPKIIYFCKFRLKRVWNYAYLACKYKIFPCTPVNTSGKRSVSSLCVAVENVENLPKPMLYSLFYVPYLCGTHWLCMTSTLSWKTWLCYITVLIYIKSVSAELRLHEYPSFWWILTIYDRRNWCGAFRFTFNGN